MNLITIVEPGAEPVTLEDIYLHLRLDATGTPPTHPDDAMLTNMITTARTRAEQITSRAFIEQTVRLVLPGFPTRNCGDQSTDEPWIMFDGWAELPRPPFMEMVQVRYYDEDNAVQTLSSDGYLVVEDSFVPRLMVADGATWPQTYRRADAVQVDYVVGYGDFGDQVPAQIKDAIKIGVQLLYDELAPEKRTQLEETMKRLLASFKVATF